MQEQLCRELEAEMECNLELIGATAIEDKLQPGVGTTLDRLRVAGIKTWVHTGLIGTHRCVPGTHWR